MTSATTRRAKMDPVKLQSYNESKDWNAAVCSNFVKAYAVDEKTKGDIDD